MKKIRGLQKEHKINVLYKNFKKDNFSILFFKFT